MKIRKGVLCLLLALLCLLPMGTAWATETEPSASAATADDPYIKDAADDSSEADDLQWYRDNSAVLENRSIIRDALRSIGWGVTKLVCKLANVAETLCTKTFGMIDITNYPQINKLLETLKPVLAALTVLCCAGLGIMLLVQQEKHPPLLRNILLGIVAVSASAYLFSTANDLVISFRDGILGSDEQKNQSYALVNSNLIDLVNVDLQGDINALNYKAGKGILYGAGIADQYDMDGIDLSETLDWYTKSNGKDLYGWSANFNNRVKFRLAHTADGDVTQKNYDGITKANIGNEFYYRYSFDFWGCLLQLGALCILFLALCYKNIRIAYELVVGRIMAYLFAADIGSGEKLKNTLLFVRDTYITMCVCVLSVKLYEIMVGAITSFGLTGLGKGLVSLFIAYAVIDGPNLVERILGMDAGLSSSVGRAMAIFGAGKAAGRTAMAVATGTTVRQRQAKGSTGEQFGKKVHQKFQSEKSDSAARQQAASEQQTQQQQAGTKQQASAGGAESAAFTSASAGAAAAMDAEQQTPHSFSSDFMDAPAEKQQPPRRVSNPAFSAAVKRLTPSSESSAEERKDFNRQVTAIVRGRKHRAIQPPAEAKPYQIKNYEKALQLEQAYHSYSGEKPIKDKKKKEDQDGNC